jgi:N-acetylmuramoyl-L-alanine amidase
VLRFNNPPPASGKNLAGARIVIDPGHGVGDSGALGFLSAYPERTINYGVASRLANLLAARGASVTFINSKKTAFSLEQRVTIAAEADPQLFISVHANSSAYNHSATGTEAYYFTPYSAAMAKYAAANVSAALNTINRGYKFGQYYVTRNPQYPSILVETGFVSNEAEYRKLIDDGYQNSIANALADAVCSFFSYMGSDGHSITGTQTSTSSAPQVPAASQSQPDSSAQDGEFSLSTETLDLEVGDVETLEAFWENHEDFDVDWGAQGDQDAAVINLTDGGLEIVANAPGTVTITASPRGGTQQATCVVTIRD